MGDGDVADVCRLTCAEQGVEIVKDGHNPQLNINGLKIFIQWPDGSEGTRSVIMVSDSISHLEGDSQKK
jgi:hypothetical protein